MQIKAILFVATGRDGSHLSFGVRVDDAWIITRDGVPLLVGAAGGADIDEAVVKFLAMCDRSANRHITSAQPPAIMATTTAAAATAV